METNSQPKRKKIVDRRMAWHLWPLAPFSADDAPREWEEYHRWGTKQRTKFKSNLPVPRHASCHFFVVDKAIGNHYFY